MSHDRGCFKCGKDQWEYDRCEDSGCPKRELSRLPKSVVVSKKQETDEMITKTIKWTTHSAKQISLAGGDPESVLKSIPDDVIITLVRNNLYLTYKGEIK